MVSIDKGFPVHPPFLYFSPLDLTGLPSDMFYFFVCSLLFYSGILWLVTMVVLLVLDAEAKRVEGNGEHGQ